MVPEAKDRAVIAIIYHPSATIVQRSATSAITADLKRLGAPREKIDFTQLAVMKPETAERPFSRSGWIFELKYDGFRALIERKNGEARISYRSGRGVTAIFPEIAAEVAALPFDLILDGEIVIVDENGRPDFNALQRRAQRTRQIDVARAVAATPATFFAFDLLALDGYDLRRLPLSTRKDLLRRVLAAAGPGLLRYTDEVAERGEDLFAAVSQLGLEGVVAKRADSPYRPGYSSDWLKIRVDRTADLAILGFEPAGRDGFRCLHVGVWQGSGWVHAGTVGTGFDRQETAEIHARLETARRGRLGRARARLRGPLQGMDTRRAPPAACFPPPARGQGSGGVPAAGRRPLPRPLPRGAGEGRKSGNQGWEGVPLSRSAGEGPGEGAHQSRQGLLAGGGLHQGGPDRVLPDRVPLDAAVPLRPPARARPLSERDHRQVVLPEARARHGHRRPPAHRADPRRRHARDRLLPL